MKRIVLPSIISLALCQMSPYLIAQEALSANTFEGIWSGTITTPRHEFWNIEDFLCFAGCPVAGYEYYTALLDDPANDERPTNELSGETVGFMRQYLAKISSPEGVRLQQSHTLENDSNFECLPYGYVREALNPLPMEIRAEGETLIFDYEEWNLQRTIYMDGRHFPEHIEATPLGYSIGYIEESTLIIETRGLEAEVYVPFITGGSHSDQLNGVEHYTLSEGNKVLTVLMTLNDPLTLTDSLVLTKHWVSTPDLVIVEDRCEDTPGQF